MVLSWDAIQAVLSKGMHVLLYGVPGVGKTHVASKTADGRPVYKVTLTEETAAAEMRGHYIPRGSEFVWHDGPGLMAWRNGGRLVADEIDRASGDLLTFMYGLLDDPSVAMLTLPSGESIKPMAGFQCIATTNCMELESALPPALLDRFSVRINIDELHPDALARLSPDLRLAAPATLKHEGVRRISYRQWSAFDGLRSATGDADMAARAVFGDRATDVLNSIALAAAAPKGRK